MEDKTEHCTNKPTTSKKSCNGKGNSHISSISTNNQVSSDVEENGHVSPVVAKYNKNNNNNNNNNGSSSNNNEVTSSKDGECGEIGEDGECGEIGEDGHKSNGQTSDNVAPVSAPSTPPLGPAAPPLGPAAPQRTTSACHSPDKGGHYHHHVSGGGGAEYYLTTNANNLGQNYIPASTSQCTSSPSDSYPSSNVSHAGGTGSKSRGDSPGEGGGSSSTGGQHVVHVHVNPGETFSVRLGDQIQHIQDFSMPGLLGEVSSHKCSHGITTSITSLASPASAELERSGAMPSDCTDKPNAVIFARSLVERTSSLSLEKASCQAGMPESKVRLQELAPDFGTGWQVLDDPGFGCDQKSENTADCNEDFALVDKHDGLALLVSRDVVYSTSSGETLNCGVDCDNSAVESMDGSARPKAIDVVVSDRIIQPGCGNAEDRRNNDYVGDNCNRSRDMIAVSDNVELTSCINEGYISNQCNVYHNDSPVDIKVPLILEHEGADSELSGVVANEVSLEVANSENETVFCSSGSIVGQSCGEDPASKVESSATDISSEGPTPEDTSASNEAHLSENNAQRQRSLEPDTGQTKQCLVKSRSSRHLQRSKSYPHMAQRALFTPIRPSPEQSGLFTSMEANHAADAQLHGSPVEEVARHDDPANDGSSPEATSKRHTKQQLSNPPVARVNPQANLNPSHAQQHYSQQEQLKDHAQHHHLYCQHLFALQPGYFLHDASSPCQQAFIPVMFLTDPLGGYYLTPDYMPDSVVPPSPGHEHALQYPLSVSENPSRTSSQSRIPQDKQSHHEAPARSHASQQLHHVAAARSHASHCAQGSSHHGYRRSSKRVPCQNIDSNTSRGSTHDSMNKPITSQSFYQRRHKTPLLPDPLIPKFSEMASLAANSCPTSSSMMPHHATPEYQQQPYYCHPFSSTASILHMNPAVSSVFLQQVPFPASNFTPAEVDTSSPQPPASNLTITYQLSGSADGTISRNVDSSGPSDVDFAMNQSGLDTQISQLCPEETSSLPAIAATSPPALQNDHQHDPNLTPNGTPHTDLAEPQYSHGMVYIPDGSGSYIAVEAANIQAHLESMAAYQGYQPEEHRPYLLTNSTSHVIPAEDMAHELQTEAAVDAENSPATVRMVSSNGPPVPLPMQVPPGHMVQQIVDEHGILTHVILSPQPPGPGGHLSVGPFGGPASGSQYYTSYGGPHYAHTPPQYSHRPHPHSLPAHVHGGMSHGQSQSSPNCTNHVPLQAPGDYGSSTAALNSRDERTVRMRNRVRKKLQQRRVTLNEGFYPGPRSQPGRRSRVNDDMGLHGEAGLAHGHSPLLDNEPLDIEEENSLLVQCLSSMPAPKVTSVEARSSLIQLSPPDCECTEVDLDPYDIKYELLLSDKGRDAKYKTVFCGDASEITLKDLKPATEYHLKVCAMLTEELKGALAEPVSFRTLPCEPDTPQPPKLISKTKTSLLLKWNAACENGSKITAYSLEYDQGLGDGRFCEVYAGLQRQFKVPQLNASTRYSFRLAAINNSGKSAYSEEVIFFTSGSVPSQTDPPMLSEQFVNSLTISWIRRPNDDEFLLQMEDETTGHGFITVYNGTSLSAVIRNLRRNMEYKFRLCAKNEEGQSKWSEAVSYKTKPDRPDAPSKAQIKGKMSPYSFRVTWDPPQDTGGSDITKYILELDNGQGYNTVYEGCEREHQFDQLLPGTLYHVRVACCSAGGRSDLSPVCVATTLPVIPGQCQIPKLQGKPKATSLHLRWCSPDYDGGSQVTHFSAQMISPDNTSREVYKGHDRDCIVAGLLPGRPYLFQVRAFNRVGAGPWSEPLEVVSGAGVPDEPRIPHVTSRSAHSALVTWEEPLNNGANISEYRLEWQQQSDTAEFSQLYLGPNLLYEVKGLAAATAYTFRVQAINSAGPGLFSPVASWLTPASNPSPVVTVKVRANTTSALVSWSEPNCNGSEITSYNMAVNDKPPVSLGPVTEHLLEDLHPETAYKVRIQATNSVGVGAYSTAVKFSTKAQPPSPPHLECSMLAPCSIKLKWGDGRNTDHLTYTLEMEKDDGSFQPVYTGPAQTHKVTRLTELTSYEFRMFASNDAGSGPYSDTYTFTTTKAPPPPLKAPRVMNLTLHGCHLDWQEVKPMSGDPVIYVLQLLGVSERDAEYKQIYKGPKTEYHLDSLHPGHEYQVRVAAVRLSSDNSGDITGAFSPGVLLSPHAAEPLRTAAGAALGQEEKREEKKPWTDQQYAAMILCIFVVLAIVSAFLCHQVISYMSGPENPASSSSSASSTLGTRDFAKA